jgi:hypothetical protein
MESGFMDFPYAVPRWSQAPGEEYGRGPADMALPDIKTLNQAKKFGLKAWALSIAPPWKTKDTGVIGNINITPDGIIIVRDMADIEKMDMGGDFNIDILKSEELRHAIKQMFLVDQIEALVAAKTPQRTATEVILRYEVMQELLGPVLGNLEFDLLNILIDRCFDMLLRANALPEVPGVLAGRKIDVEYQSPLHMAQRSTEARAIISLYTEGGAIAEMAPDVFDTVDSDKALKEYAKIKGVPLKVIRDAKEVEGIRAVRQKRAAQEQAVEQGEKITKGIKNVAPLLSGVGSGQ